MVLFWLLSFTAVGSNQSLVSISPETVKTSIETSSDYNGYVRLGDEVTIRFESIAGLTKGFYIYNCRAFNNELQTADAYKELVLVENYCARTGESSDTITSILDQIGTSVTTEDENIKLTFRQFAFTEIIDNELKLHFDIKCSLRLGAFPGCPPLFRSRSLPKPGQTSWQSAVVASSDFDWSASWEIETEMSTDQAIEQTQNGILLHDQPIAEVLLDTESSQFQQWTGSSGYESQNGAKNILQTKVVFALILILSLF